ncbi:hypothetical protein CLAFUW4_09965 [Fulvia fulva]|uniref:Uncharacterized protein n=1 Tax=Passalora fulva TaxID=5499 RepID=A0A9Q8PI80_PASFU|nr:uncharacterized protein CLAFUR5_12278 [Fulvia fulva]KAK4616055.1 hypothetical protein CLAFUR4_09969 [Fulvia fulva]KAK4617226.1 hypothetical protein CLAFUR0_09966 [Fulvia fulva]UJO22880.1 hypothetical protein CLAFUR5_12278 [Fulvia fulva]WPV19103.1 hypothetical protein CLAFUW4_09965 [Fulvia fulva]WPV34152.1 hypothetical protein CLAFUW7_09966 [Fulvia fulva]
MKAPTIGKLTALLAGQLAMGQGDAGGYIAVHPGIVTVTSVHTTTATRFTTIYANGTSSQNATRSLTNTRKSTTNSLGLTGPRPTAIKTSLRPITTTRFLDPNGTAPPDPNSAPSRLSTSTSRAATPSLNTVRMTTVCGDWGCAYAPVSSASMIATSSQTTTAFQWVCPTCLAPVGQQDNTPTTSEPPVTRPNIAAFSGSHTGRETRCSFLDRDKDGVVTGTRQSCSTIFAIAEGSRTIFELASTPTGR